MIIMDVVWLIAAMSASYLLGMATVVVVNRSIRNKTGRCSCAAND